MATMLALCTLVPAMVLCKAAQFQRADHSTSPLLIAAGYAGGIPALYSFFPPNGSTPLSLASGATPAWSGPTCWLTLAVVLLAGALLAVS